MRGLRDGQVSEADKAYGARQLGYGDGYARRTPRPPADPKLATAYRGSYRRGEEKRAEDERIETKT